MKNPLRGEVYWYCPPKDMAPTPGVMYGDHPVLIISNDVHNRYSQSVNCVQISSKLKKSPVHVGITLTKPSHIQCEQMHTINKEYLDKLIGSVTKVTMNEVISKIKFQLSID